MRALLTFNLSPKAGKKVHDLVRLSEYRNSVQQSAKLVKPGVELVRANHLNLLSMVITWLRGDFKIISVKLYRKSNRYQLKVIITNEPIEPACKAGDVVFDVVMRLLSHYIWSVLGYQNSDTELEDGSRKMFVLNMNSRSDRGTNVSEKVLAFDLKSFTFSVE